MELEKLKQEYLDLVERGRKSQEGLPFKENTLIVLKELEERIRNFQGGTILVLNKIGRDEITWNNWEVLGKHIFQNPYDRELYPDRFDFCVGTISRLFEIVEV